MPLLSAVAPHAVIDEMRDWLNRRGVRFAETHVLDLPMSQEVWFQIDTAKTAMVFMAIFGQYLMHETARGMM